MIRNRQFMTGLGIGLIVGALLLQVMLIGQGQAGKLKTKEQVEQAAASLNLKVVERNQELLTEEEWRARSEEALPGEGETEGGLNETKVPADPEAPNTPTAPADPEKSDPSGSLAVPETTTPESPKEPDKGSVKYKIAYGSTLTGVAEGLLQAGVISDKEAFLKQAKAKHINKKVRTGTFTFEVGEEYNSIISKISPGSGK
ncbi:hypothetical protein DFP94_10225 [Fontibacillus phaseoli]|uniref:YceG-like family protein n=1 Tax=Fontibacillus phaseoli TaxID=1416533 RepID=A0A369BI85_9BACL|nr:hypothetical protein [Fontibacillus phaseoli]RCX21279.1 hypothetical protein DFP94_10225 [Fontibacillus phaseoli]